ncbi:hypothetical protein D7X25_35550, partial [bacterium 1XD42-8]
MGLDDIINIERALLLAVSPQVKHIIYVDRLDASQAVNTLLWTARATKLPPTQEIEVKNTAISAT